MMSNSSDHPDEGATPHPAGPNSHSSGKEENSDLLSILQSYFPFLRLSADHRHGHRHRRAHGEDHSGSSRERRKKRRKNRGIHHRHPELFAGVSRERVTFPSASISRRTLKRRRMMEKVQHRDLNTRDSLQEPVVDREQERMMREESLEEVLSAQVPGQESAEISPLSVEVPEAEEATSPETMETDAEEQAVPSADASAVPDRFTLAKFFSFFLPFLSRKLRMAEEKTEKLSAELAESKKATEHLTEELTKTEQQTEALLKQVPGVPSPPDVASTDQGVLTPAPGGQEIVPAESSPPPTPPSVGPASGRGLFGSLAGLFGGIVRRRTPVLSQASAPSAPAEAMSGAVAATPVVQAESAQTATPATAALRSAGFFASVRGFFGNMFARKSPKPAEKTTPAPAVAPGTPVAGEHAGTPPVTADGAVTAAVPLSAATAPAGQQEKKDGDGVLGSLLSSLRGGTPVASTTASPTPDAVAPPEEKKAEKAVAAPAKVLPPAPPPPPIFKPPVRRAYEKGVLAEIIGAIKYFGMGKEQMTIVQNLAMMLGAGLPLIDSLKTLQSELHSKAAKRLMKHITDAVDNGSALWRAMEDQHFFSPHAIALIRIGEEAGNLAENMEHLAVQQEKDQELRNKVKMAMIYPSIVLVLIFVIVIGLGMFVLPNLVQVLFSLNVKLPLVTRIIIKFTNVFTEHGQTFVPASLVGMVFFVALAKYTPLTVVVQWLLFKVPGIGRLAKEATIARFGVILGGLLQAGVPLVDAIRSLAEVTPIVAYRKFYMRMLDHINVGDSFAKSFAAIRGSGKLLPLSVQQLIITGERTGSLAKIMLKISEIYEKKANETAQKLPVILEPMLLLIIGVIVGTIAFAIIVPIYSIVGNVGNT